MQGGSEFHSLGAATQKARKAVTVFTRESTTNRLQFDERSEQTG